MTPELDKAEQAPGSEWNPYPDPFAELRAVLAAKEAECEALRVEVERWAEQANKEDECRQMWQARATAADAALKRIRAETIERWSPQEQARFVVAYMERETRLPLGDMIGMHDAERIRALASEDSARMTRAAHEIDDDNPITLAEASQVVLRGAVAAEAKLKRIEAERTSDLRRLCEAIGIEGADGHSSPAQVFEKCINAIRSRT